MWIQGYGIRVKISCWGQQVFFAFRKWEVVGLVEKILKKSFTRFGVISATTFHALIWLESSLGDRQTMGHQRVMSNLLHCRQHDRFGKNTASHNLQYMDKVQLLSYVHEKYKKSRTVPVVQYRPRIRWWWFDCVFVCFQTRSRERSGYLYKQDSNQRVWSWTKRWVVFNGDTLRYYEDNKVFPPFFFCFFRSFSSSHFSDTFTCQE